MYELSNREKAYLRKIVINIRNEYLKTEKYKKCEEIELESILYNYACESNDLENKIDEIVYNKIESSNLEIVFTDKKIMKIVKAMTLREKLVLFSYYFENNTDKRIGKALNLKGNTARKIRVRALEKIKKNYLKN